MISSISIEADADTALPMAIEAVKDHLQISHREFDAVISGLHLPAAVDWAESEMRRSILTKVHRWTIEDFPRGSKNKRICLPRGKTQTVTSITYTNTSGVLTTLRGPTSGSPIGTDFREDLRGDSGGFVEPLVDQDWPDIDGETTVTITFTAGWAEADIPKTIVGALAFYVGDQLDMPTSADRPPSANVSSTMDRVKDSLLDHWRIR